MKQILFLKQLNELSPEALEVFKSWYVLKNYYRTNGNGLPNLGQLIEFLFEKDEGNIQHIIVSHNLCSYACEGNGRSSSSNTINADDELIDFIWKDVKNICEAIASLPILNERPTGSTTA